MFKADKEADICGTCLRGYFEIGYADLVKEFGEPHYSGVEGDKISTQWTFTSDDKKIAISLYDYKDTNLYDDSLPSVEEFRSMKSFEWHVGAKSESDANLFKAFLSGIFKRRVGRRLVVTWK